MKLVAIAALLVATTACSTPAPPRTLHLAPLEENRTVTMTQAVITRVIDADTVVLADNMHIRVRSIDAPEIHPSKKSGYKVECWGPESAKWANERLTNAHVGIIRDPQNDTDIYGRTVAEVWLNNGSLSYADLAVKIGMARELNFKPGDPATNQSQLVLDQKIAQEQHLGLWGPPCNGGKTR